jgi:hypothetical protein
MLDCIIGQDSLGNEVSESDVYADHKLEILVNGSLCKVDAYIFRSWSGSRYINGEPYIGPVFLLGSQEVA